MSEITDDPFGRFARESPDFAGPCPRCGGDVPNTEHKGQYPGALSRYDNATYICSACGTSEAMWQFTTTVPLPDPDIALPRSSINEFLDGK